MSEYVHNPINAFNLISRISRHIGKLLPYIKNTAEFMFDLSSLKDEVLISASGISDIYEFHDISINHLVNGRLRIGSDEFFANSQLDVESIKIISKQAYEKGYFAGYVDWLHAIIQKMDEEQIMIMKDKKYFK